MRALAIAAMLLVTACRFDVSGTAGPEGDDQIGDAVDATGPTTTPDAAVATPIDAATANLPDVTCGNLTCGGDTICCQDWGGPACTAPDACGGAAVTCDGPTDCPGQQCCRYAGIWASCADDCTGGDRVCEQSLDCAPGDECCSDGTCHSFCF